ncbi:MAG: carboxypeptidase regulatory-like domain-containing protein, partial [Acidobacteria bacterium]|nr:carboxypeptidase regulatory-like domain-containing protein [Acidobacteriota bacterium]
MKSRLALALLSSLGITLAAWAQVDTATVTGTVRDSSGAVLPNVTVTATEMNTGTKTSAQSGNDGNYVITPVKIGRYAVSAEASGFQTETR